MIGTGRYSWIGLDGQLAHGSHWDDIPAEIDELVAFVPDAPPQPHAQEDHELMATFPERFNEAMGRCRRRAG